MNQKFIRLKPLKERSILNFHPWIFSGAIKEYSKNLDIGDEVVVLAHDKTPLALAHFCGENSLFARVFTFDTIQKIDDKFWQNKFEQALNMRIALGLPNSNTNGFRLIHGEGDGFSGLVCDIFDKSAVINLTNPGLEKVLPLLKNFLKQKLNIEKYFFAHEEKETHKENFIENDLKFIAHIGEGQKTGHFLDQRENRKLVSTYAKNKNVLDAFCYSGGFSVYALNGQARSVTSVDISGLAVDQCKEHIRLNGLDEKKHFPIKKDCFDYLNEIKHGEFDLIILDPPAFSKGASSVQKAARGYKEINLKAMKALNSGGILFTFSCSQSISTELFQQIIFAAAKDTKKNVKIINRLTQGLDHPTSIFCPQSDYLKGLILYVE